MKSPLAPDKQKALEYINKACAASFDGKTEADRWLAIGYLAQAETLLAGLSCEVMGKVREARHLMEKKNAVPDFKYLLDLIERL
jgi:hypothetical protein